MFVRLLGINGCPLDLALFNFEIDDAVGELELGSINLESEDDDDCGELDELEDLIDERLVTMVGFKRSITKYDFSFHRLFSLK